MPHKQRLDISMGVELETYSIALPENRICRTLQFPKRSSIEKGEKFTRDWSIGSEYNSKVFYNVREAFFLLKTGLRKYTEFGQVDDSAERSVIFPVGGWIDRFAGSHIHLGRGKKHFEYRDAKGLANCLHDHIPFLIALTANSPVWREKITPYASNRLLLGSEKYCKMTRRGTLYKHHFRELTYNRRSTKKTPTLELRICDSSVPEYLIAALCLCCAVALRWRKKKTPLNQSTPLNYLRARQQAIRYGTKARLSWMNHWMDVSQYTDLFFRKYEEELDQMDIPDEVLAVFKYLKKGWNQADVLRAAAKKYQDKHRPTWQRQFAKRYAVAIQKLLNGNSFEQFAATLGIRLPNIERAWIGRKGARW